MPASFRLEEVERLEQFELGPVLVKYTNYTDRTPVEMLTPSMHHALDLVDTLRVYDDHLALHEKRSRYFPGADFVQRNEDGEDVVVARVQLTSKALCSRR